MTSSTQEYLVKRKAFAEEFEKLGGYGVIGRLLAKIMSKSTVAKDMVGRVSSFASKHSTKMTNPAAAYSKSGKVFDEGMEALKATTTTGKATVKPWLGKTRQPLGIRESKKIDLFKDPLRSVGQTVMTGAANLAMTAKTIAKKGLGKYIKEDFIAAQHFSKTITGKGGKKYDVLAKRSLAGRIANPVFETAGIGFGGMALATNKYDEQGKKRGISSRVGGAVKETVLWGPLRPLAMAHLTTVELPKMTKDIIKGF